MDTNVRCHTLCKDVSLTHEQSATLEKRIRNNYYVHLLVDNLPCATKYQNVDTREILYEHGYRLGMYKKETGDVYLNNHLIIKLHYHKESGYEYESFFLERYLLFLFKETYIELLVL
jgi:transmembrane 9 superfamily protein 2/4